MIRGLKLAALGLAVLLVVLLTVAAATLSWVLWTESGSRFAVKQARSVLPPGIELGTHSGRLGDYLEFNDVAIELEGLDLTISRLWLRWSPGELLGGHLSIAELGAAGVRYRAVPVDEAEPDGPDEPLQLPERVELPVSVTLQRVSMEDIEVRMSSDAAPLKVDQVLLTGATFADSRLELDSLEVDSPLLSAEGRLAATAAGDYPLEVHVAWRFSLEGYAPVGATTDVTGSLASLNFDQRIAAPYNVELAGTAEHMVDPDRPVAVNARLTAADVRLAAVQAQLPDATLNVNVDVDGPVDALAVQADVSGNDPEQRRFVATLRALVENQSITLEHLAVRQAEREGQLTGQGRIALGGEVAADLSIGWDALRWPLTGEPTLVSPRGSLELDGPLSGYQLSLDTRLEPSGSPPLDLRLDGHGSLASVSLTLNLQAGDGSVQGEIDAAWDPVIQGEVSLALKDLDPSVVAAEWPGSVDAKVAASAQMEGDRVEVTVSRLDASGRLRDQDLSVAAQGRYVEDASGRTIDVDDLVAALGATRVDVNGRVGERADLRWQLASDDLSGLLPEARGRLSGSGQLTGPLPEVSLEARLEADNLAYAEHSLQRLDLSAELDLSGGTRSQLNVAAQQASLAGTAVSRLTLEGSGTAANHHIQLLLNAEPGRAEIGVDGNLEDPWGDNPAWHFTLSEGELAYQQLAPWRLAESAEGTLTGQHVRLARQCWEASQARVCLQGHRDSQGLAGDLDLSNLRFAYFAGLLPKEVEPTGAVSGSARVVQPDGGVLTAQADVTTTEGQVSFPAVSPEDGSESAVIRFQPSNLTFSLDASEARGEIDLNLEHGQLRAQAATPVVVSGADDADARQPPTDPTLTGSLVLDVPDLSFLSPLLPTVEALKGKVSGDLRLAGTMGQPAVTGSLDLSGGSVFVPEPGITVTDLSLSLQGRGRDPVALQASASSGGGSLSLDGSMSLPGAVPTARLAFTGNEFQVLNNDDGRVFVSPDLNLDAGPERVTLSGRVHVPRAEITPESRSPSAATVSQDQVLVSEEAESATEPERELHAEVRLTLGDQVHFDGFGLTARIEGDVLVEQQPETPTTATGELRILDGEYRAYGQGLVIDSGRIYFAGGPVTQPALDVRAVRRPKEGILVGAHVQGTLQSPSFELFSEPSMAEQEQLSYLVLGRSLDEAPDGQGSALSRAALAMGLKGGDFLAKNIGQQVGLDQIGIETGSGEAGAPSDPSDAALVVGKYLSPKLYVSYGIGLFDPESVLEMQYEISRRWTFVTQSSGESTGADVLYTVELGSK